MNAPPLDRVPPQDLAAEQAVLGAMLMERDAVLRVRDLLGQGDFYSPQHQLLYAAMCGLAAREQPVDLITVSSALQDAGQYESVGGRSYLIALQDPAPTAAAVETYAQQVLRKARLRALIQAADDLKCQAYAGEADPEELCSGTAERLYQIGARAVGEVEDFGRDIIPAEHDLLWEQSESPEHILGIDTGIPKLNRYIPGWLPSTVYMIGGRPSAAKSGFMLQQCVEAACDRKRVLCFSLEMPGGQLARRYFASTIPKDLSDVMQARLTDHELQGAMRAAGLAYEWQFYLCQRPALTASQVRGIARNVAARRGGLDLIAIDYIQLMEAEGRYQNDNARVAQISRGVKALSRELNVPVLALSQLSRKCEDERRWPRLSDLRESGNLEQDADVVIFLHYPKWLIGRANQRPDPECPTIKEWTPHMRGLDIAKHRNGRLARFPIAWHGGYQRFTAAELDMDEE